MSAIGKLAGVMLAIVLVSATESFGSVAAPSRSRGGWLLWRWWSCWVVRLFGDGAGADTGEVLSRVLG